jgi:DNA invertase Pin-like site-specific DNA recombinase
MILGYARVSTKKQETDAQIEQLTKAGAERIYQEKISAKNAERPELKKMMQNIRAGDVVIITKLDRLARSLRDLLNILEELRELGASFKSLGDPLFDTTSATGALMSQILGAVAEFERKLIRERTEAGKARARIYGTKSGRDFGRPRKLNQAQRVEALERLKAGETLEAVAATYGVHFSSISRLKTLKLPLDAALAAHSNGGITRGY